MRKYNHKTLEKKWQAVWESQKPYSSNYDETGENGNFYILDMFPYPSSDGLHMGHTEVYVASDIYYRYKKMQGFNVLHPQGFDSFGLPAENFAIKTGTHPSVTTERNMLTYIDQWKLLGLGHDFDNLAITSRPDYYQWTQWLFGQFFKHDLVYKKTDKVNWCPSCNTILANEQVEDGKCERCKSEIVQKDIPAWFFKITRFADDLIEGLDTIDWPESTKKKQINWIGKSEGSEIDFQLVEDEYIDVNRDGDLDSYQDGVEEVERNNVVINIQHPSDDTFLCLSWKKVAWNGFVTGGIEDGDTIEQTALKEVIEETGYQNPEIVKVYPQSSHGKFYHVGKKINRFAHYRIVHVKLRDLEQKDRSEEESEIADIVWKERKDVSDFISREDMRYPWRVVNNQNSIDGNITIFTTRADTLCGATYVVVAPEHPAIKAYQDKITNIHEVLNYQEVTMKKSELERLENKEKTGVRIEGLAVLNPANGEQLPLYVADYVLARYGTGAVMAVPSHDQRDFEFATTYNLPRKKVIEHQEHIDDAPFLDYGIVCNSGKFDGMTSEIAKKSITDEVGGRIVNQYRLRDWSVSRQRYWGCPIPIVYNKDGEAEYVGDENLPWLLPTDVDFVPTGTAPLAKSQELVTRVKNLFGEGYTPEVETLDTFVDSAWYMYRYPDTKNDKEFCSPERMKNWLSQGVDLYIGGAEHTYMHLLYARFFGHALHHMGYAPTKEPFKKLRHQGMVNDKTGAKMSKSKGNVVNPNDMVDRYGADAVRTYMMFAGPLEDDVIWNEENIVGVYRFLEKVYGLVDIISDTPNQTVEKELHKLIKRVTQQIEELKYNTAVSDMMKFINVVTKEKTITKDQYQSFLALLSVYAPHVADELCEAIGAEMTIKQSWPTFDAEMTKEDAVTIGVQINGKRRTDIEVGITEPEESVIARVKEVPEAAKWLAEGEIKKVIYVPGKILNIIVG